MGTTQADGPVYLRNTLAFALSLPLVSGGRRYLPACDTTCLGKMDMAVAGLREAVEAGFVVGVVLPPAKGGVWRLGKGCSLRSPISPGARQVLAERLGMAGMVEARMRLERAAAETAIYDLPRWRKQEWRADRAWRLAGERARGRVEAVKRHTAKVEAMWAALQRAMMKTGRPMAALNAVLDGEAEPPAELNGHASAGMILPRKTGEAGPPTDRTRKLRRMRRVASARRLISAAAAASGERDLPSVAAWLAQRLEPEVAPPQRERDEAGRWLAGAPGSPPTPP